MTTTSYISNRTGLLFVDPYNDFLSAGGKLWPLVKGVAKEVGLIDNLRTITAAVRKAGIQVFIVPHHRWEPGDYENWDHATPYQLASGKTADIRERLVGRRVASRFRAATGRHYRQGTLGRGADSPTPIWISGSSRRESSR